jgi:hypothetical protein
VQCIERFSSTTNKPAQPIAKQPVYLSANEEEEIDMFEIAEKSPTTTL